jgi:hypothetical protein
MEKECAALQESAGSKGSFRSSLQSVPQLLSESRHGPSQEGDKKGFRQEEGLLLRLDGTWCSLEFYQAISVPSVFLLCGKPNKGKCSSQAMARDQEALPNRTDISRGRPSAA